MCLTLIINLVASCPYERCIYVEKVLPLHRDPYICVRYIPAGLLMETRTIAKVEGEFYYHTECEPLTGMEESNKVYFEWRLNQQFVPAEASSLTVFQIATDFLCLKKVGRSHLDLNLTHSAEPTTNS